MTATAHLRFMIDLTTGRIVGLGIYSSDHVTRMESIEYFAFDGIPPATAASFEEALCVMRKYIRKTASWFGSQGTPLRTALETLADTPSTCKVKVDWG